MKRRDFLKNVGGAVGIAAVASVISAPAMAEESRRKKDNGPEMVSAQDPTAKAIGYVEDATKSTNSKGNKCATCNLYQKKNAVNGKEAGACTIFPNKFVYGNAYCNSWAKKS